MGLSMGMMCLIYNKKPEAIKRQFKWLVEIIFGDADYECKEEKNTKKINVIKEDSKK